MGKYITSFTAVYDFVYVCVAFLTRVNIVAVYTMNTLQHSG